MKTPEEASKIPASGDRRKSVFKFDDDDEDDEWEALPPFLRRKK